MTLLASSAHLRARAKIAAESFSDLSRSLASELDEVIAKDPQIPSEKAKLSREGGRCPDDGSQLDFDPFSPLQHSCPRCGRAFTGDAHYRWWIMSQQLFLSERAVHGALLFAFNRQLRHAQFSERVLERYCDVYPGAPNSDNVLGPTRLFFSTYLESIWLLQISVALDLLETSGRESQLGGVVRERVIRPSAELIASYDEGTSNRQAWNCAALLAAAAMLGEDDAFARAWGRSLELMRAALFLDGSWYEGENYHLFAHRGLWYIAEIGRARGYSLPEELAGRYVRGFASVFRTALPDMTLLSRRDSQYAVSLRQWRFAELCELGIAATGDARHDEESLIVRAELAAALRNIYAGEGPGAEPGRRFSTAEVERNLPAAAITRRDLGWKSLLRALPQPLQPPQLPRKDGNSAAWERSALLPSQGLATIRRDGGRAMIALDYGHHGGGHGHPDRLNLGLYHGEARWLDDMGTGSYVSESLFWYRSGFAHNAPMQNWRSQNQHDGVLLRYQENDRAGFVSAALHDAGAGVLFERTLVVLDGYLVDQLTWNCESPRAVQLPLHLETASIRVAEGTDGEWLDPQFNAATLPQAQDGGALDAGLAFVTRAANVEFADTTTVRLECRHNDQRLVSWLLLPGGCRLWSVVAPGPPPAGEARSFLILDSAAVVSGVYLCVHDWAAGVADVQFGDAGFMVQRNGGRSEQHILEDDRWRVSSSGGPALNFERKHATARRAAAHEDAAVGSFRVQPRLVIPRRKLVGPDNPLRADDSVVFELGEPHFRRSELNWLEHGGPTAAVLVGADAAALHVSVIVNHDQPCFARAREGAYLDNENPDVNSDGVQIHFASLNDVVSVAADAVLLLIPEPGGNSVRVTARNQQWRDALIACTWRPRERGYVMELAIDRKQLPDFGRSTFFLDVVINLLAPGRERRSGQLMLGSASGEWIYLMGNRQSPAKLLPFRIGD